MVNEIYKIDVVGETCPVPLVEVRKAVLKQPTGTLIEVIGSHPPSKKEIPMALESMKIKVLSVSNKSEEIGGQWRITFKNERIK